MGCAGHCALHILLLRLMLLCIVVAEKYHYNSHVFVFLLLFCLKIDDDVRLCLFSLKTNDVL